MEFIHSAAGGGYDIIIGGGLLRDCGNLLSKLHAPCRVAVVADDTVAALYGDAASKALSDAGFDVSVYAFPHGEASKNLGTYADILDFFASRGLSRTDVAVALGGGVTGDLCGFAAATYMRGIDFLMIPTTLLSAVDSSVGGKTGVDLPSGKNLCGAFRQPIGVICDTDIISGLPDDIFASGMAEVIKYGAVCDLSLLSLLEKSEPRGMITEIVSRCVKYKAETVGRDEFDRGERRKLNFGHTAGHALELLSDFTVTHGEAVAAGMVIETEIAEKLGVCPTGFSKRIEALNAKYRLHGVKTPDADTFVAAMLRDKKNSGGLIGFSLPDGQGGFSFIALTPEKVNSLL